MLEYGTLYTKEWHWVGRSMFRIPKSERIAIIHARLMTLKIENVVINLKQKLWVHDGIFSSFSALILVFYSTYFSLPETKMISKVQFTCTHFPVLTPTLQNGQENDSERHLEPMSDGLDQKCDQNDDPTPSSLRIIMLPDGGLFQLLLALLLGVRRRGWRQRHEGLRVLAFVGIPVVRVLIQRPVQAIMF